MRERTSPHLYKLLYCSDIFCLPHPKTLRTLTSALKVDSELSGPTMTYLKLRVDQLEPKDRLVNLAMDEVYTAQTVEFSGGRIFRETEYGPRKNIVLHRAGQRYFEM